MLDNIRVTIEKIKRLNADEQELAARLMDAFVRFSEQIAAHEAAESAHLHLAAIVESADLAIISKNLEGYIQSWNPGAEHMFGYSPDEIIGQPVTRLLPEGHEAEEAAILERLKRGERIEHYESVRRRKDGSHFPVSLTISPIRDDSGAIIGASKIARDITDQKRFEEQATLIAQLQKALGEVKALKGLLPICSWCKKIRDDQNYWHSVEEYLSQRTDVQLTHGICPDCYALEFASITAGEP